ncbi:MAG: hypothetical protein AAFR38_07760 [Planctomycetota bacterium]
MKLVTAAAAATTSVLAAQAGAGPINLDRVPADAGLVIHVDVERCLDSNFAGAVLGRFQDGEFDLDLDDLAPFEEFGINPFKTILGVTVISYDPEDGDGVVVIEANEGVEDFLRELRGYEEFERMNAPRGWTYGSVDGDGYIAFRRSRTDGNFHIIVGEDDELVSEVLSSPGGFRAPPPPRGAMVYGAVSGVGDLIGDDLPPFFSAIDSAVFAVAENDEGLVAKLRVSTEGESVARSMSQAANGMLGLLAMSMPDERLSQLAAGLEIVQDENSVVVTLQISEDLLAGALEGGFDDFGDFVEELEDETEEIVEAIEELEEAIEELEEQIEELAEARAPRRTIRFLEQAIRELEREIESLERLLDGDWDGNDWHEEEEEEEEWQSQVLVGTTTETRTA